MMNRNEKLEIAKRLRLSTESELSRDDLEQILDAELSKPEAEMDTELVQQIVDLLEETPSQAQQREAWRKTDKRLKLKQWQPVVTGLTRIAAVGVILVALMFATYGTAKALNWEFLLRWMRPFAETFMIYSGDDPVATPEPKVNEVPCAQSLSHVRLFVTPWTVARRAPLSVGFSRQDCWSGLPLPPPGVFNMHIF